MMLYSIVYSCPFDVFSLTAKYYCGRGNMPELSRELLSHGVIVGGVIVGAGIVGRRY